LVTDRLLCHPQPVPDWTNEQPAVGSGLLRN
jgi:hypothetical protein